MDYTTDNKYMILHTIAELNDNNRSMGSHKLSQILKVQTCIRPLILKYSGKFSYMKSDIIKGLIDKLIHDKLIFKKNIKVAIR